jgi:hypothetical protein
VRSTLRAVWLLVPDSFSDLQYQPEAPARTFTSHTEIGASLALRVGIQSQARKREALSGPFGYWFLTPFLKLAFPADALVR